MENTYTCLICGRNYVGIWQKISNAEDSGKCCPTCYNTRVVPNTLREMYLKRRHEERRTEVTNGN